MTEKSIWDEVNVLSASGMSNFRIQSYDGDRLLMIGSFDLCYYHDIELTFTHVSHIHCSTQFHYPAFSEVGTCDCCDGRRFAIRTDTEAGEIVAQLVGVTIGKVYHYDRGSELQPGERIADWVRKKLPTAE